MKYKICAISDIHGHHWKLKIPKCDFLIVAGDMEINSLLSLQDFNDWLGTIKVGVARIVVGGNHDSELQAIGQAWCEHLFTNAVYLEDKEVTIDGLKFYGSPWSPEFNNWSFMYPRRSREGRDIWKRIPENTDILITHTMPYKILDTNYNHKHCGCEILSREIFRKNIKIQIGGHLHEHGNQHMEVANIKFYNVSVLDEKYKLVNKPTTIYL